MAPTPPTPPRRTILLTGFPTFAARYLFYTLVEREPESTVLCLVRSRDMERAAQIVERRGVADRVRLLEGDIRALDFGLTGKEYLEVTDTVTDVYHLEAVWHTSATRERLWEVNVQGTQNVLDCVGDLKNLNRYNHFSTAYVCGDRSGVIMEEEFDKDQSFRNPYEQTQFEAERRVRQRRRSLPISVYRPSVIVGHSHSGQIDRLGGPYLLMQPLVNLPVDVPLPIPGEGNVPLNLVPVDYVTEALYTISVHPDGVGRTFHLVDPDPLSARLVFELVALAAGKPLPKGRLPVRLTRMVMKMPLIERTLRGSRNLLEDFNRWCVFNAINTHELTANGPHCPPFPDYVEPLVAYLRNPKDGGEDALEEWSAGREAVGA